MDRDIHNIEPVDSFWRYIEQKHLSTVKGASITLWSRVK